MVDHVFKVTTPEKVSSLSKYFNHFDIYWRYLCSIDVLNRYRNRMIDDGFFPPADMKLLTLHISSAQFLVGGLRYSENGGADRTG